MVKEVEMSNKDQAEAKFRGWFRHENGDEYSMVVKGAETFGGAAEVCSVEEEAYGAKCTRIETVPNEHLEKFYKLECMLDEVKKAMLIGADPDYFTDHGQMEDAVTAVQKILSEETT